MPPQSTPKRAFGRFNKTTQCDGAEGNHDSKKLFCGTGNPMTFCVKQSVPERARLIKLIESHGGKVVEDFNDAQFVLADPNKTQRFVSGLRHIHSYKLVMDSIQANRLQRAAEYKLLITGERNGRRPFSQQDDKFLEDYLRGKTAGLKGNKIYKELEKMNDKHTWQSWRSRAESVVIPNLEIQRTAKKRNEIETSTNTSNVTEYTEFTDLDDQATEQVLNNFLEKAKENEIVIDLSEEEDNYIPEVDNETNRQKANEDSNNVGSSSTCTQTTLDQGELSARRNTCTPTTLDQGESTRRILKGDVVRTPVKWHSGINSREEIGYEVTLGSYVPSSSSLGKRSQIVEDDSYNSSGNSRHKPFTSRSSQDLTIGNDVILLDSPEVTWPGSPSDHIKKVQERIEETVVEETPCPVSITRLGKRRQIPSDVEISTNLQSKRLRLSPSPVRPQVPSPFKASGFPIQSTNICNEKDEKEFLAKVKEISEITHRPLTLVIKTLGETTCNFEMAKDFLINGATPNNSKYIWTNEEDTIIISANSDKNKMREIVDKHGTNLTKDRIDFLKTYVTHH